MKVTDEGIEVYFSDLDYMSQEFFLKVLNLKSEKEGNFDVIPIALVPLPDEIIEENNKRLCVEHREKHGLHIKLNMVDCGSCLARETCKLMK